MVDCGFLASAGGSLRVSTQLRRVATLGVAGSTTPLDAGSTLSVGALFARYLVDVALLVTVGAVAGAALPHFVKTGTDPARPSHAPATPPADAHAEVRSDDGRIDSQSVR